jgi:hypothetical protein
VVAIFAPEDEHVSILVELIRAEANAAKAADRKPSFYKTTYMLDVRWGLEQMIARLAGVPREFLRPTLP